MKIQNCVFYFLTLPDHLWEQAHSQGQHVGHPVSPHPSQHSLLAIVKTFACLNPGRAVSMS